MSELSGSAIRVYLKIVRNTIGWRDPSGRIKGRDWITHSQFEKTGISNRSVTSAIEELLQNKLITVTDYTGSSLNNPTERKKAKRVYYSIVVDNLEKIALQTEKNDQIKPQDLRTTKETFLQNYNAENASPDQKRIKEILEQEQRKQVQRDRWV
jgi:Mn-dependent DtxR family transcriptional regulator